MQSFENVFENENATDLSKLHFSMRPRPQWRMQSGAHGTIAEVYIGQSTSHFEEHAMVGSVGTTLMTQNAEALHPTDDMFDNGSDQLDAFVPLLFAHGEIFLVLASTAFSRNYQLVLEISSDAPFIGQYLLVRQ